MNRLLTMICVVAVVSLCQQTAVEVFGQVSQGVTKAGADETAKPPIVMAENTVLSANLPYVAGANAQQTLDIYAPKDASSAPVYVFIHGGGWNKRDKDEVGSQPRLFNTAGVLVVSVNYRLVPTVRHPDNVRDVAAAIAWIHKNVANYGGDPRRIFLMGHSAGSHLAALVATDDRYLAAHNLHRHHLAGVISLDGSAFDIPDRIRNGVEQVAENCRRAFGEEESVQRDGSPMAHVMGEHPLPPFLLIYLKEDGLNHRQSRRFAELVRQAQGAARLVHIEDDKTHQSLCDDLGTEHDTTGPILVDFVLKGAR